jgi:hypothetical protein
MKLIFIHNAGEGPPSNLPLITTKQYNVYISEKYGVTQTESTKTLLEVPCDLQKSTTYSKET